MSSEFHTLEESLKKFLSEEQSGKGSSANTNLYKYNNLKIYMDPKKSTIPHFIVRIGISESMYNLSTGEKLSGGFSSDEALIRKWIDKNLRIMNLDGVWKDSCKPTTVTMNPNDDYD